MSTRADYTVEEWEAIRRTPSQAVVAIEQASKSSFLGRRRERKATEKGFKQAIEQFSGLGLLEAIVAASEEEGRLIDALRASDEPMIDTAIESARAARRAINAKGSREEAEAFANAVIQTCERVAEASAERGEDRTISHAEGVLLKRIGEALGIAGYEPPNVNWVGLAPVRKDL